jgi:hypothetical protein
MLCECYYAKWGSVLLKCGGRRLFLRTQRAKVCTSTKENTAVFRLRHIYGGPVRNRTRSVEAPSFWLSDNGCVKKYEIISIEHTDLANHWVITYRKANGLTDKQSVVAIDSNDAFIVFRNQMIRETKAKVKIIKPK